jgi:hypothetical protein
MGLETGTGGGGSAVALREAHPAAVPLTDDEIRVTYRVAEALYQSGAWKLKNAEAAFAKIVIGRDLGLSPAQAMQGIHIVEGGIQMHYSQLGQFIRAREGYDYRAGWIKVAQLADVLAATRPDTDLWTEEEKAAVVAGETRLAVVPFEEEEPTDLRPIVGAYVEFIVNGERRGISRFTLEDARAANLIKPDARAAWNTAPRNMLFARAMSNGAKWFVPEVFGGMPVYVDDEIPERKSITAPAGDGDDGGAGIDLGPKVDAMIERAERLGHRGLSNRAAVEVAVGKRAPGVVNEWLGRAKLELDRFEREKSAAEETSGDPKADAVVVEEKAVEEPEEEVTGEAVPEEGHGVLPDDAVGADDPRARLDEHLRAEQEEE